MIKLSEFIKEIQEIANKKCPALHINVCMERGQLVVVGLINLGDSIAIDLMEWDEAINMGTKSELVKERLLDALDRMGNLIDKSYKEIEDAKTQERRSNNS